MHRPSGFNIFELMLTLIVLAIVTQLAVGGIKPLLEDVISRSTVSSIHQALRLARQSAVEHQQTVTLCPLDEAGACGNDWHQPLSVFLDPDNTRTLSEDTLLLHVVETPAGGRVMARPEWKSYFQFDALGETRGSMGHVAICPPQNQQAYARIVVSMSGRSRVDWDNADPVDCQ